MVWFEKLKEIVESPEAIELRLYRNKVRDQLLKEISKKREEMLKEERYPYWGEWLTLDEIALMSVRERKENTSRLVIVISIFFLLSILAFGFSLLVWLSAR